ncbi:MAG TPA: GYF domain-containing protein [Gemmataceae bacterium]|jgi:S1-C subfamily serine protease|nr:GYF domain-containing protein [Gemmataceae bacterium]
MLGKALYIRVRGKVLGPFTLEDLRSLRDRGQFRRFHEISEDRRSWAPATSLGELFPSEPVAQVVKEESLRLSEEGAEPRDSAQAKAANNNEWYYADEAGGQQGPISKQKLLDLWGEGQLDDSSYVWNSGMTSWQALSSLPELGARPERRRRAGKAAPVNKLAFASFILGLVWLGGLASVAAIVLGYLALRQISRNKSREGGRRMALIGIFAGAGMLVVVTPLAALLFYHYYGSWGHVQRLGSAATAEEITAAFKHRVFLVKTSDKTGSGILIANNRGRGLIVTNRHVITPVAGADAALRAADVLFRDVSIKNPDQITAKTCRVAAYHHRLDLALLIAESESLKPSSVAIVRQKDLRQGEPAVALGSPLGLEYFTSPGVISSTRGEHGFIWTTCPINKGNSGGPLFLARHGLLAGITTIDLQALGGQNLGGCVPAEEVIDSLQRRQLEAWEWRHEYKDTTLELADLVPLED